ncbi:MAG: hypothetical protein HOH74_28300, partial [Gemmatimonadetes bacterium]|nr:hypothetical protein [Gemmatimonadota bacterium]
MPSAPGRFSSPSDRINFGRLLTETRRLSIYGLLIASTMLSGGAIYGIFFAAERTPPPPALTRLVIRKPRSTKQFVLKRQRLRPRAMTKEVTALRPRLQRKAPRLQGLSGLGRVQTFDYALDTGTGLRLDTGPIELSATRIEGT